ncbi:MAG: P-loop NTPase, partial [bacterium]|nr:P-loop NTPase [bacterium]
MGHSLVVSVTWPLAGRAGPQPAVPAGTAGPQPWPRTAPVSVTEVLAPPAGAVAADRPRRLRRVAASVQQDPVPPAGTPAAAGTPSSTPLPTDEAVLALLSDVIDPELGSNIVELGMVQGTNVDPGGQVTVTVALTTLGCPLRAQIQRDVRNRVATLPGVSGVDISWTELSAAGKAKAMRTARRNVAENAPDTEIPITTKVLLIASGKGGVGKSSISVNLAMALATEGFTVGLLDADIWGYSVPRMLDLTGRLEGA